MTSPAAPHVPAKRIFRTRHPAGILLLLAAGALGALPLLGLSQLALGGDSDVWPHLAAYVLLPALHNTALLIAGVAVMTTLAGVGTAWLVTTFQFPGRNAFVWLLPLPLAIPTYISAYVYVEVFDALGTVQRAARLLFGDSAAGAFLNVRTLAGAVFVMGVVLYPYVYLAARAAFQMQGDAAVEAARTLGASYFRAALNISLPLARPAIAAGLALALLETLNDIGASEYLGVQTLTLSVFSTWLNRNSIGGAAQLSCVMLIAVAALIAIERSARRGRRFSAIGNQATFTRKKISGTAAAFAITACALPVLFGFAIPGIFLAYETLARGLLIGFDPMILGHTATTLGLASGATAVILILGFGAAIAAHFAPGKLSALCLAGGSLGYAIPGTVLALGLLTPMAMIDSLLIRVAQTLSDYRPGLVLTGTCAGLVLIYVVRFSAIAIGLSQAGLARIPKELDDAARVSGASAGEVMRSVHLPLARPAIWGAALLIFVDCLKELPATLMLRPLNVETLATYIFQFATRGSFEQGALAALLIVVVGIVPVIRMIRFADADFHAPPLPNKRQFP